MLIALILLFNVFILQYCLQIGASLTIGYIYFRFFTNCKKFDFSDSFSFDYDPNGISLGL